MTTDKELIATLERANTSYAHAFDQARTWQDLDPEEVQALLNGLVAVTAYPKAAQAAANVLAALRGLPHEVAAPTSAQSTARIKVLEARLAKIAEIAAGHG